MNPWAWQLRIAAATLAVGAVGPAASPLGAQATLPATATTAITPSQLPSANPPVSRGHADVAWDGHLLRISANGESLSEVLAAVADRTDTRFQGTVLSEPIFGTYGPAPIVDVLSDLLSGLPLNMLYVRRVGSKQAQLTLTARSGGATPPSPEAQQQQFAPSQPQSQQAPYTSFRQPSQPPPGSDGPPPNVPSQPGDAAGRGIPPVGANPGSSAPADSGNPADDGTNPTSPNGVKTPQEIFEQLQRLRSGANGSQSNPQ